MGDLLRIILIILVLLFLTLDYFKADLRDVYKILIWPSAVIFVAAFLVLLFFRIF